ncbi:MAG: M23 family metallopeptidase [Austwickia sp.]|jgi:murein DD-endopeptidase MepM/ murein hydrolase activator NlpD|nr:MAG: M23 family metallopeptidase [Austwickia sp.]
MPHAPALVLAGALLLAGPAAWAVTRPPAADPVPAPASARIPAGELAAVHPIDAPPETAAPSARPAETGRWAWPLTPRPAVVRAFDAPAQPWLPGHRGVDLRAAPGAAVRSPAAGVVAFRGMVTGRPVLSIDHAGGIRSTYEPVLSTLTQGTTVSAGQIIGTVEAGHDCPTPTCLHWGARRGETYVDPLRLLDAAPPILLPMR